MKDSIASGRLPVPWKPHVFREAGIWYCRESAPEMRCALALGQSPKSAYLTRMEMSAEIRIHAAETRTRYPQRW